MVRRVAVAASGGRDSTALLHVTARAARDLGVEVVALHVHHGLMAQADDWLVHVQRQCARWARTGLPVTFVARRLKTSPRPGDSVEAWARRERYQALGEMAREQGVDLVLLAHHRLDQAETVLLQALRGAGSAGLAAMPRSALRGGIQWSRPWRDRPRDEIEAYVRRHRLRHVDDDSNHDAGLARGRLRQQVWPALQAAFPDADITLSRCAARAHESAQLGREVAESDLSACGGSLGQLSRAHWLALSPARRTNLLRHWLNANLPTGAPDSLVARLCDELPTASTGQSWPTPVGVLRLHRGVLMPGAASRKPIAEPRRMDLSEPGRHELSSWHGAFIVKATRQGGVPAAWLHDVEVGSRVGGEQFQQSPKGVPRSLKKAYQSAGLGIDGRHGPLIRSRGELIFVAGLGMDARAVEKPGQPRRLLSWISEA